MSGIASVIVAMWLQIKGKPVLSSLTFWIVACVCLFIAFFQAWLDEHKELISLQNRLTSPDLSGEITTLWWGKRNDKFCLFISGQISNPTGPPSAITNWKMSITVDGSEFIGMAPLPSGQDEHINLGENREIILPYLNYWPLKTSQPIPAGGISDGWILSTFNGITEADIHKLGAIVTLSFSDVVTRKTHHLQQAIKPGVRGITIPG
jgi:hypothetical protein